MHERSKVERMRSIRHFKLQQHEDFSHEDNQEREPATLENQEREPVTLENQEWEPVTLENQ